MLVGYVRVSTGEQNDDLQQDALKKAGCEKIFTDTASGSVKERSGLMKTMEMLRDGDTLVVWKLDRLGRSLPHLVELVNGFKDKGIEFRSLQESIDTNSGIGKLVFHLFASLAEFERDIIRERTMAGLNAARARGRLGGRPKALDDNKIIQAKALYKDKDLSIKDICSTLGIGRTTFYRYVNG